MKSMLDAGVHFGHQTQRWNPKMKPFVFTSRGGIHIIDLQQSVERARAAADFVTKIAADGGRMIFVGTKKQAIEPIQDAAKACGQFYVTKRWLGGMLTNFETIKQSIERLRRIDQMREKGELEFLTKKERAGIEKEAARLLEFLEGIREMREMPKAMFVVDLNKEHIAVAEARRLGIAVIGIADTNVDPELIDFPIPGNDDAIRSIKLFSSLMAEAFTEGAQKFQERLRTETDKGADLEAEMLAKAAADEEKQKETRGRRPGRGAGPTPKRGDEKPAGPTVVKAAKTARKLVAAGTADEIEIQQELEAGEKPAEPTEE
jgi:small subunit ribosomal protein S2